MANEDVVEEVVQKFKERVMSPDERERGAPRTKLQEKHSMYLVQISELCKDDNVLYGNIISQLAWYSGYKRDTLKIRIKDFKHDQKIRAEAAAGAATPSAPRPPKVQVIVPNVARQAEVAPLVESRQAADVQPPVVAANPVDNQPPVIVTVNETSPKKPVIEVDLTSVRVEPPSQPDDPVKLGEASPDNRLKWLFEQEDSKDMGFDVGGRVIKAHSLILNSVSRAFKELAMSDDKIVKIVGVDAESFEIFIRYLYTNELPVDQMKRETIVPLLQLAVSFDLKQLKPAVETWLMGDVNVENSLKYLSIGRKYGLAQLPEVCLDAISLAPTKIFDIEDLQGVTGDVLYEVLSMHSFRNKHEHKFRTIHRWYKRTTEKGDEAIINKLKSLVDVDQIGVKVIEEEALDVGLYTNKFVLAACLSRPPKTVKREPIEVIVLSDTEDETRRSEQGDVKPTLQRRRSQEQPPSRIDEKGEERREPQSNNNVTMQQTPARKRQWKPTVEEELTEEMQDAVSMSISVASEAPDIDQMSFESISVRSASVETTPELLMREEARAMTPEEIAQIPLPSSPYDERACSVPPTTPSSPLDLSVLARMFGQKSWSMDNVLANDASKNKPTSQDVEQTTPHLPRVQRVPRFGAPPHFESYSLPKYPRMSGESYGQAPIFPNP